MTGSDSSGERCVEEKKYKLCIEVLKRFNRAGILKHLILVGSWSIYFYKYYFNSPGYSTFIRTTDIDFLIPVLLIRLFLRMLRRT